MNLLDLQDWRMGHRTKHSAPNVGVGNASSAVTAVRAGTFQAPNAPFNIRVGQDVDAIHWDGGPRAFCDALYLHRYVHVFDNWTRTTFHVVIDPGEVFSLPDRSVQITEWMVR